MYFEVTEEEVKKQPTMMTRLRMFKPIAKNISAISYPRTHYNDIHKYNYRVFIDK